MDLFLTNLLVQLSFLILCSLVCHRIAVRRYYRHSRAWYHNYVYNNPEVKPNIYWNSPFGPMVLPFYTDHSYLTHLRSNAGLYFEALLKLWIWAGFISFLFVV